MKSQTVTVNIRVKVELNAKYTPAEVKDIIERNSMLAFKNNQRHFDLINYEASGKTVVIFGEKPDPFCDACGHPLDLHQLDGECYCGEGDGNRCDCRGYEGKDAWKVEQQFIYGWDDAPFTEDDEPMRFSTREAAQEEIDTFIADQHEAFKAGHMDSEYNAEDYRPALA
tara:strand:- start:1412 stop:1918 length:507 start_codon:yes stop_codon:yes gene_type:complete